MVKRKKWQRPQKYPRKVLPPKPPSQFFLDSLHPESIKSGSGHGRLLCEYHWILHTCLAHQRSLIVDQLREWAQKSSSGTLIFSSYQRVVKYKFSNDPLSMLGSFLTIGGRFNIGSIDIDKFPRFPALYLAENQKTALLETFGQSADPHAKLPPEDLALANKEPYACVAVNGVLEEHIDLRDAKTLDGFIKLTSGFTLSLDVLRLAKKLKIQDQRIIRSSALLWNTLFDQNWRLFPRQFDVPSNSQILGQIFSQAGIQGILYSSVKGGGQCLAVFPQNFLNSTAYVELSGDLPPTVSLSRYDKDSKYDLSY